MDAPSAPNKADQAGGRGTMGHRFAGARWLSSTIMHVAAMPRDAPPDRANLLRRAWVPLSQDNN